MWVDKITEQYKREISSSSRLRNNEKYCYFLLCVSTTQHTKHILDFLDLHQLDGSAELLEYPERLEKCTTVPVYLLH